MLKYDIHNNDIIQNILTECGYEALSKFYKNFFTDPIGLLGFLHPRKLPRRLGFMSHVHTSRAMSRRSYTPRVRYISQHKHIPHV